MVYVPYQEVPTPPMDAALREACQRAVHVRLPNGEFLRAGRAVIHILALLGYRWVARFFSIPPFYWLAEVGYWFLARHRGRIYRWFFRRLDEERDEPPPY